MNKTINLTGGGGEKLSSTRIASGDYTSTIYNVPYGTTFSASVRATTTGYTPGTLNITSGTVTSDITIQASPAISSRLFVYGGNISVFLDTEFTIIKPDGTRTNYHYDKIGSSPLDDGKLLGTINLSIGDTIYKYYEWSKSPNTYDYAALVSGSAYTGVAVGVSPINIENLVYKFCNYNYEETRGNYEYTITSSGDYSFWMAQYSEPGQCGAT